MIEQLHAERETIVQTLNHWANQLHDAEAQIRRAKAARSYARNQVALAQGHLARLDWCIGLLQPTEAPSPMAGPVDALARPVMAAPNGDHDGG